MTGLNQTTPVSQWISSIVELDERSGTVQAPWSDLPVGGASRVDNELPLHEAGRLENLHVFQHAVQTAAGTPLLTASITARIICFAFFLSGSL